MENRIEAFFLILALAVSIFLNACYISGLYYDHDISKEASDTLDLLSGKGWRYFYNNNNFPPGINLIHLLAFSIFGKSFISIQIFSLLANLLSVILIYFIAKYLFAKEIKLYFLLPLFYALFSVSEGIQGHTSNLETFLAPFEIAGILCLGLAAKNKKSILYFLSGAILGLGFLIKQTILATFIAGLAFMLATKIVYKSISLKKFYLYTLTFLAPFILISVYYFFSGLGIFSSFIENAFIKNFDYVKNIPVLKDIYMLGGINQIWRLLKIEIIVFGLLSLVGIIYLLKHKKTHVTLLILLWIIIPTAIFLIFGLHFRHHFIEILAPSLVLSIAGASKVYETCISRLSRKKFLVGLFMTLGVFILAVPFFHLIGPLIVKNKLVNTFFLTQRYLNSADKDKYAELLFNESPEAAKRFLVSQYIKERTNKEDKIFVWDGFGAGSIYLWAERDNATEFKGKYPLLPKELRMPVVAVFKDNVEYKLNQKILLQNIVDGEVNRIAVMPDVLPLEKDVFPQFFGLLETKYYLEKEIMGCEIYRLKDKEVTIEGKFSFAQK
jgi:4-amino-4-deoxy-L-arabinose transferase-like glycosyltransferase